LTYSSQAAELFIEVAAKYPQVLAPVSLGISGSALFPARRRLRPHIVAMVVSDKAARLDMIGDIADAIFDACIAAKGMDRRRCDATKLSAGYSTDGADSMFAKTMSRFQCDNLVPI
jgi:hypothetical protein